MYPQQFADDTKLSGAVDTTERKDITQRDLDRLKKWAHLMRFNNAKCKVLHFSQGNPRYMYRLPESNTVEKALQVLVDGKLAMSHQCAPADLKSKYPGLHQQGCDSREREVTVPLCSAFVRPHLEHYISGLGSPVHKGRRVGAGPEEATKMHRRSTSFMKKI